MWACHSILFSFPHERWRIISILCYTLPSSWLTIIRTYIALTAAIHAFSVNLNFCFNRRNVFSDYFGVVSHNPSNFCKYHSFQSHVRNCNVYWGLQHKWPIAITGIATLVYWYNYCRFNSDLAQWIICEVGFFLGLGLMLATCTVSAYIPIYYYYLLELIQSLSWFSYLLQDSRQPKPSFLNLSKKMWSTRC